MTDQIKTPEQIAREIYTALWFDLDQAEQDNLCENVAAAIQAERDARSCARDQGTTQFCAEAVRLAARLEKAEAELDRLRKFGVLSRKEFLALSVTERRELLSAHADALTSLQYSKWESISEKSESDNFATSIYGEGYKGLLIARCDQNGERPWIAELIADAPKNLALRKSAEAELAALKREVAEVTVGVLSSAPDAFDYASLATLAAKCQEKNQQ